MTTTVFFRNFSGALCTFMSTDNQAVMLSPIIDPQYYAYQWSGSHPGEDWDIVIRLNGKMYKYKTQLDSSSNANVYLVANNLLDVDGWTPDSDGYYNKYLYSEGYQTGDCYCVGDSSYSPTDNYTKFNQGIVMEVPGAFLASLTPVQDFSVDWQDRQTIAAPSVGPSCTGDEDGGSNWYWWLLGVGLVLLLCLILAGAAWYVHHRRSTSRAPEASGEETVAVEGDQ